MPDKEILEVRVVKSECSISGPCQKVVVKKPLDVTAIVEEDGLHVMNCGAVGEVESAPVSRRTTRKFVNAFRKVWRRIPEQDRTTLLGFWRRRQDGEVCPRIVLGGVEHAALCRNKAACVNGRELYFDSWWVEVWKRATLCHVIAHELAHVICYPHGWYRQHECTAYHGNECVSCECRAYSYMAAWGFDPFHSMLPKPKKKLAERFRCLA